MVAGAVSSGRRQSVTEDDFDPHGKPRPPVRTTEDRPREREALKREYDEKSREGDAWITLNGKRAAPSAWARAASV